MRALVAFNRDRDSYQVPIALAEHGSLACLVTDYYRNTLPINIGRLQHRWHDDLPATAVRSTPSAIALQAVSNSIKGLPFPHEAVARAIGRRTAETALNDTSITDLVLYSTFAHEAFETARPTVRKTLFVFHPHPFEVVARMTTAASLGLVREKGLFSIPEMHDLRGSARRLNAELRAADFVVTASQYTLHSIRPFYDGNALVVPYGMGPLPATGPKRKGRKGREGPKFLFVGAGQERKGLASLLLAWDDFRYSNPTATLTVVVGDPGHNDLQSRTSCLSIRSNLRREELDELYDESDVFVLPSWCEGFGLAYTEALARDCHVIGTPHSGLPDLDLDDGELTLIDDPEPESVLAGLTKAFEKWDSGVTQRAHRCRGRHRTWQAFRDELWTGLTKNVDD